MVQRQGRKIQIPPTSSQWREDCSKRRLLVKGSLCERNRISEEKRSDRQDSRSQRVAISQELTFFSFFRFGRSDQWNVKRKSVYTPQDFIESSFSKSLAKERARVEDGLRCFLYKKRVELSIPCSLFLDRLLT